MPLFCSIERFVIITFIIGIKFGGLNEWTNDKRKQNNRKKEIWR